VATPQQQRRFADRSPQLNSTSAMNKTIRANPREVLTERAA
jgi:hypothetical protein